MTLYADLFFLENLIMNYFIISCASLISSKLFERENSGTGVFASGKPMRRLLGSAVGAAYALVVVLLPAAQSKILGSFFGKLTLSLIIVYIVFIPGKLLLLFKESAVFCVTGFLFAGISVGISYLGVPFTLTSNGLMITELPSAFTTAFLTIGIGCISVNILLNSLGSVYTKKENYVSLYIEFDGNGLWLPALVDTGNELRDPLTGTPVIIVESKAISSIVCPDINLSAETVNTASLSPDWARRFRVIPFSSLGCENGLLPGFKADSIKIRGSSEMPCGKSAIVCLYDRALSDNKKYSALLSPELVA